MNYNEMKLPELKAVAKDRKIKGYSSLNKAQLIEALSADDKPAKVESVVEAIKAAIRNAKDARRMRGVAASQNSKVPFKQTLERKAEIYAADRNGGKMSARQRQRYRKAFRQGALPS